MASLQSLFRVYVRGAMTQAGGYGLEDREAQRETPWWTDSSQMALGYHGTPAASPAPAPLAAADWNREVRLFPRSRSSSKHGEGPSPCVELRAMFCPLDVLPKGLTQIMKKMACQNVWAASKVMVTAEHVTSSACSQWQRGMAEDR